MSNCPVPAPLPRGRDLQRDYVDGAIAKLVAAVSLRGDGASSPRTDPEGALVRALARVITHFGFTPDEVSIAVAVRESDVGAAVRRVCEQHHIHVREVQLHAREKRTFGAPVLAFRGEHAVVLMPGVWRRWVEVGAISPPLDELQPRAFTFYRMLRPEAIKLAEFWRAAVGPESRRELAYAVVWGVVASVLSATSVYLMRALVEWALPQGDHTGLSLLAAGWCVVALSSSNLRMARALLQARVGARVDVEVEATLVGRALSLPMSAFKDMTAGDLSERIRDACQFGRNAYGMMMDISVSLGTALAYAGMLATTSTKAVLVVGAVLLVRSVLVSAVMFGLYVEGNGQAQARGQMSARLFELLRSILRIKVATAEERAFYQWAIGFAKVRQGSYRVSLLSGLLTATEGLFDIAGTVALYAACAGSVAGPMSVGEFVVAIACLAGVQAAYSDTMRSLMTFSPMLPKAQRIRPLLDTPAEVHSGASALATLEGGVSLRNVTFHYADAEARILDNVSLDIHPGQFVAIVGPSGCGKSTLVRMILGFYAPASGSVLLDGRDLSSVDVRAVRRQVGAVLQASELLPSSILFNIVGTTNRTIEDAWRAARRACIADDIEELPMKMWTMLSDRAVTISGGQKQRILVARALVREPKLIVFDEATSALDNKTQAGVMASLREMPCTKICVAHRLSTVVHADLIVVMNKGTIVQQGTYGELMREEGLFRTLAETQLASDRP